MSWEWGLGVPPAIPGTQHFLGMLGGAGDPAEVNLRLPPSQQGRSWCRKLPLPSPSLTGPPALRVPQPLLLSHPERPLLRVPKSKEGKQTSWGRGDPGQAPTAPSSPVTFHFPSSPAHLAACDLFPFLFSGCTISSPSPRLWGPVGPLDFPCPNPGPGARTSGQKGEGMGTRSRAELGDRKF